MTRRGWENPDIVVRDGKPVAVILKIEDYRDMLMRLGDTEGLAELQRVLGDATHDKVTDQLLAICHEFTRRAPDSVVFDEPYIPYIPDNWNGVLVLAIAQNIPEEGDGILVEYHDYLRRLTPEERFWRLYANRNPNNPLIRRQPDALGIGPWDDRYLKAVKIAVTCLGLRPQETAVANAVPWSRRTDKGHDSCPTGIQHEAISFWQSVFAVWGPEKVIALGRVSEGVVKRAGLGANCIYVPFPSSQYITVESRSVQVDETLRAYPVIAEAIQRLGLKLSVDDKTRQRVYVAKCAIEAAREKGWDVPVRLPYAD